MTKVCNLCPRKCGVNRSEGERGVCGAGEKVKVALASLHYWEEPPISGKNGSGTIFFSHCSLKCIYCQNATISRDGKGREVNIDELQNMMLDLQDKGAENINFVTGTHFAVQIIEACKSVRHELKIPIVWNTSSYETVETISKLNSIVDIYLADFKYCSNELAASFSSVTNYFEIATKAINAMVEGEKKVIVRHLVLPGHVDDSKNVIKHVHETFGDKVKLSIMNQYTPVIKDEVILKKYPELGRTVTAEEYEEVLDFADSHLISDYFWQEGETCKESFIPNF